MAVLPKKIDMLVFDFDGVFTTNEVIVNENGEESVICNRSDGHGISLLHKLNIPMMIISKEKSAIISHRANKLKIPYIPGADDKLCVLKDLIDKKGLDPKNIVYMGNDTNDQECMMMVGVSVCPCDAHPDIRDISTIVLEHAGGKGAVRELVDYILEFTDLGLGEQK
jgi:YrbI family 3-deoxy-D-manno-octulosonate 8-phosphate phosphatase